VAQPWRELIRARLHAPHDERFDRELLAQWRAANHVEALVPFPRADIAGWVEDWNTQSNQVQREIAAYWWVLSQLPAAVDFLFFAPWLRTGGGDSVLLQYIEAVIRAEPDARVALITTEPVRSTRLAELTGKASTIELAEVLERGVSRDALVQWIVPQMIAQVRPRTVHAINSTVAFDVVEQFGADLARDSAIFLSTFAIDRSDDGEKLSVMYLRRPGFLDPVERVLVDSETYVDRLVDELGYERRKFTVQRSVVNLTRRPRTLPADVGATTPLRVLWTGRFDLPKRLDILAEVAVRVRERAMPVEIHFYGLEVMGSPELAQSLRTLEAVGAVRHPPYSRFSELPLDEVDAYLLTSEWEGIPLSLLEAMAAGVPVIAPLVGGVGEVLDETVGYPVTRFDDIEAYLHAFDSILANEGEALKRAERAAQRIARDFSAAAFDRQLRKVDRYLPRDERLD
jgi:glycosyltransferase involved in cell wall biosynthesis